MTKIIITGGTGRFGNVLKKYKTKHKLFFPTKNPKQDPTIIPKKLYLNSCKSLLYIS